LCQFKIVKPTRQPGGKTKKKQTNKQALKNKIASSCCMDVKYKNRFNNRKGRVALKHLSMMVKVIN
jgi:hypothetical protein